MSSCFVIPLASNPLRPSRSDFARQRAGPMGAAESTPVLGGHEELLETFVGSRAVPLHDPFWDRLLSFSYALPKIKPEDFDEATREACTTLGAHSSCHQLPSFLLPVHSSSLAPVHCSFSPSSGAVNARWRLLRCIVRLKWDVRLCTGVPVTGTQLVFGLVWLVTAVCATPCSAE